MNDTWRNKWWSLSMEATIYSQYYPALSSRLLHKLFCWYLFPSSLALGYQTKLSSLLPIYQPQAIKGTAETCKHWMACWLHFKTLASVLQTLCWLLPTLPGPASRRLLEWKEIYKSSLGCCCETVKSLAIKHQHICFDLIRFCKTFPQGLIPNTP